MCSFRLYHQETACNYSTLLCLRIRAVSRLGCSCSKSINIRSCKHRRPRRLSNYHNKTYGNICICSNSYLSSCHRLTDHTSVILSIHSVCRECKSNKLTGNWHHHRMCAELGKPPPPRAVASTLDAATTSAAIEMGITRWVAMTRFVL